MVICKIQTSSILYKIQRMEWSCEQQNNYIRDMKYRQDVILFLLLNVWGLESSSMTTMHHFPTNHVYRNINYNLIGLLRTLKNY